MELYPLQNLIQKVPNPSGRPPNVGGVAGASQPINSPMLSDLDRSTTSQTRERGEAGAGIQKYVPRGATFVRILQIFPATLPDCGAPQAPARRHWRRLLCDHSATTFPCLPASPVPTTRSTPCQSPLPPRRPTSALTRLGALNASTF